MRASEPVARTTFFAFTVSVPPAVSFTSTENTPSFAPPVSLPKPLKVVILFFFIRKSRPLVWRVMTSSLRARTFFQFSFASLTPSIPYLSACFRWSHTSAVKSMALVGIHPHSRQVPPRRSFASIRATLRPYCDARIAKVYPAGPPPTTTASKIVSANGSSSSSENFATFQFYAGLEIGPRQAGDDQPNKRPARAAVTSWGVLGFAWVLPMDASRILSRPAGGQRGAVRRCVNAPHAQWAGRDLRQLRSPRHRGISGRLMRRSPAAWRSSC